MITWSAEVEARAPAWTGRRETKLPETKSTPVTSQVAVAIPSEAFTRLRGIHQRFTSAWDPSRWRWPPGGLSEPRLCQVAHARIGHTGHAHKYKSVLVAARARVRPECGLQVSSVCGTPPVKRPPVAMACAAPAARGLQRRQGRPRASRRPRPPGPTCGRGAWMRVLTANLPAWPPRALISCPAHLLLLRDRAGRRWGRMHVHVDGTHRRARVACRLVGLLRT